MSLKDKPHHTPPAAALADWIESQSAKWWAVDGDPELPSIVDFLCPSDELAPVIRTKGKDLLVYDWAPDSRAQGEKIGADRLPQLANTKKPKTLDGIRIVLDRFGRRMGAERG
jgi:hypothetical protein